MNTPLPALALLCLTLCAPAEEALPTPPAAPGGPSRPAPEREQIAMQMMVRKLVLDRYDADNNLRLDAEERHRLMADAHAARKQQALAFIRRFDADGDGALSPEERKAMQQVVEERRHGEPGEAGDALPPPPPHPHANVQRGPRGNRPHGPRPQMGENGRLIAILMRQLTMEAYDADQNGILDTEESDTLRQDGDKLYEARKAELLARFDSDGDGRLSEDECRQAFSALRPRRPQGAPPHNAEQAAVPPPPRHHRRSPIHRLLDTHFDIDIIRHLARPTGGEAEQLPTPCKPSTPSAN